MFNKRSITGRILVGEITGLIIGALALITLPFIAMETPLEYNIGFLLLMVTMGAMIGLIGMYTHHPVFPTLTMKWWLRGTSVGILFFLILALLAKDQLTPLMSLDIVAWTGLTSPYWVLLDGAFLGGLIGYITTKICGEGNLPIT
jgi:hypothetical protein